MERGKHSWESQETGKVYVQNPFQSMRNARIGGHKSVPPLQQATLA